MVDKRHKVDYNEVSEQVKSLFSRVVEICERASDANERKG